MARVLVVEDQADVAFGLRVNLERAGHVVTVARDGASALKRLAARDADIVLLDLSLPDLDGFEVLRRLRQGGDTVPVLVLTARREQRAKLHGLREGADDYLTKPFDLAELLLRVEVILRRAGATPAPIHDAPAGVTTFGGVTVDPGARTVRRGETPVILSRLAFDLLLALLSRRGAVVSRADLLREVWGYADTVSSRTIDTHVFELRRQLEREPAHPRYIHTVWGIGYRLSAEAEE